MTNHEKLSVMAGIAKGSVKPVDVASALGMAPDRHGRCRCPFHNGKDRNMALYETGFKCYVCHEHGDIFDLIACVTGMPFPEALRWLNSEFQLGMDIDSAGDETRLKRAKKRQRQEAEKRKLAEWQKRICFDFYLTASEIVFRLEEARDRNRPRRYSEDWNSEFCDAVRYLPEIREAAAWFLEMSMEDGHGGRNHDSAVAARRGRPDGNRKADRSQP